MAGSIGCTEITADWKPFTWPPAEPGGLHIWHVPVNTLLHHKAKLQGILLPDERLAAARYRQQYHQDRYIVQHGLLRLLLGWYLGKEIYPLPFVLGANKKPYLPGNPCYFNISHTDGHLLLGIASVELGVDIEYINPNFACQDIVSHYFGLAEQQYIAQAKNSQAAFFLLWTRKEALLKSSGLSIDDNLPLIPALNGTSQLPAQFGSSRWLTQSFLIGDTHVGSLTRPKGEMKLNFWEVSEL